MKRISYRQWTGASVGIAAALSFVASSAFAAQQPERGPGGGPPPPFPGGGRPGQRAPMLELSAATVPVRAMERALGLSDDQKTRLRALAFTLMEEKRDAQPLPPDRMGSGGGPGGGGLPDRAAMSQYQEQMRTAGEKMRALDAKAAKDIEALLTGEQKRKLPDVIAEATLLRSVGLPIEATGDLNLTAEQKTKLEAIADEVMAPPPPGGSPGFVPGGPGGEGGFPGGPPPGGGFGGPGRGLPNPPGGQGSGPPPGGGFPDFRRAQEERRERVMGVLTEEQRVKARDYLRRYQRPMMGGMPGMMGPGGGGPGAGRPGFGPGPGGGGPGQPPPPPGRGGV